jgi:hypothetical protein
MSGAVVLPVDNPPASAHRAAVSKKVYKVEEPQAPYAAKPAAKAASRAPTDPAFKRIADKIFAERKELLRKLAQ